jgi:glycolate oxidase FAD binding subunit
MGLGNAPRDLGLILSTKRMNRVLEHAAGDLVVRVEAGARLRDVQATLATAGQWLALDPPEPDATIGGIIAANSSGPRRLRYGTARDLLIGITYVLPDGTVAKSGGKVVKNVAGYDLNKLFTGSLGTLGLIVEAIFRLHPVPAATRTVMRFRKGGWPQDLSEAIQAVLHSSLVPSAMSFRWDRSLSILAVRFDGIEPGVDAQIEVAAKLLEGQCLVEANVDPRFWDQGGMFSSRLFPQVAYVKVSEVPANLPLLLDDIVAVTRPEGMAAHIWGCAGNGITTVGVVGPPKLQIEAVDTLRSRVRQRRGSLVVTQAPAEVKRSIDVWGDVGAGLPLMRRIKEMFDPNGIMNPGRFVGGI